MEILKFRVKKDVFDGIVPGEMSEASFELTPTIIKKISKDGKSTKEEMAADPSLIKEIDTIELTYSPSSEVKTIGVAGAEIREDSVVFQMVPVVENTETKEPEQEEEPAEEFLPEMETVEPEPQVIPEVENPVEVTEKEPEEEPEEEDVELEEQDESDMESRVDELIGKLAEHDHTYVVSRPSVIIKRNGYIIGLSKRLPLTNDNQITIDIEKQVLYHTYDKSDDEFLDELSEFFRRMVTGNFVFLWKSKCKYKVDESGKRYLVLYYTTRKYVNQKKNKQW